MPKLKSKSSAMKRFSATSWGKIRRNIACNNHMLRRRSQKMKRKSRGTTIMCAADSRIIKQYLPDL